MFGNHDRFLCALTSTSPERTFWAGQAKGHRFQYGQIVKDATGQVMATHDAILHNYVKNVQSQARRDGFSYRLIL
jgi:hypothetical protein